MSNILLEVCVFLVLTIGIIMTLDVTLYWLLPFDNIRLVGMDDNICDGVYSQFNIPTLGCALRGSGIGYVKLPLYNIAVHENVHAMGYKEPMASAMTIIQLFIYCSVATPVAAWVCGICGSSECEGV